MAEFLSLAAFVAASVDRFENDSEYRLKLEL